MLGAETRARRIGWLALGVNVGVAAWAVLATVLAVSEAPARRYVRAGAMLSTTVIDESTLARDMGSVVQAHASAINEAVAPQWPELAQRTLDANTSMRRATLRHVDKTVKTVFADRKQALRDEVRRELSEFLPTPALTPGRIDLLLAGAEEQARQTLRAGVESHSRRARRALASLVRELPAHRSEPWTRRWTEEAVDDLDAVGRRFVAQHGGLDDTDGLEEGDP